jgi:hypothetical protein
MRKKPLKNIIVGKQKKYEVNTLCSAGLPGAAAGAEPERMKDSGVLYGDGHYYRKDRREKVSYPTSSQKTDKVQVKQIFSNDVDMERSALVKP